MTAFNHKILLLFTILIDLKEFAFHKLQPTFGYSPTTDETISSFVDKTIEPCEDFYQFSCGNFLKTANEGDRFGKEVIQKINERLDQQHEYLADNYSSYLSDCLNNGHSDAIEYFLDIFKQFGGWPVLSEGASWTGVQFDWLRVFEELKRRDLMVPFPVDVIDQYGIHIKFLKDLEYIEAAKNERLEKMVNLVVNFGASEDTARKDMLDCLKLEMKLGKIKVATPIGLEHLFQVQSKNKWFPWDAILQSAIMNKNTKRYRHKLIFVSNPRIVEKLREVLVNTPKRVFANYMLFKVVESNLMGTFEGYGYFTESKNPDIDSATNEICQNFTREYINVYGLVNYVNSFSGELFKSDILKSGIIENIKNQFLTEFKRRSDIYSDSDFQKVEKLFKDIKIVPGYPDRLTNPSFVNELFSIFKTNKTMMDQFEWFLSGMKSENFFELAHKFRVVMRKYLPESYTEGDNRSFLNFVENNAFFFAKDSFHLPMIVFGLSRISAPYYSSFYPAYINYGRFGYTLAHELGHGIVRSLQLFSRNESTCLINQYNELQVDGIATLEENLPDNLGIRVAYAAYVDFVRSEFFDEPRPENFSEYSPQQMFWISAATSYCGYEMNEIYHLHSPSRVRINAAFSNSKDFQRDFKCDDNSGMKRIAKCTIL